VGWIVRQRPALQVGWGAGWVVDLDPVGPVVIIVDGAPPVVRHELRDDRRREGRGAHQQQSPGDKFL